MTKGFLIIAFLCVHITAIWAQFPDFSNMDQIFTLTTEKNGGETFTFVLAPEAYSVNRPQHPIVFIDWEGDGNRQMLNLVGETSFTVKVPAGKTVLVTGEDGIWKLVSQNEKITTANVTKNTALHYLDLNDNLLGKANGTFAVTAANKDLETLHVNGNQLKTLSLEPLVIGKLKELHANTNLFSTIDLTNYVALQSVDMSKNLLSGTTGIKLPVAATAFAATTWVQFTGGNASAYTAGNINTTKNTAVNLSVNKLNIATLPVKPTHVTTANYIYSLQQRYVLPQSAAGNNVFKIGETIDISDQLSAQGVTPGTNQTTRYAWYIEEDAATDQYTLIPESEYSISNGVTTFNRGFGRNANIFCAMTTAAFPNPLESFERKAETNENNYTSGFDDVLVQPAGGTNIAQESDYTASPNNIGDGTTRAMNTRFFRTNTITLNSEGQNYWYGYIDNDWAKSENWTGRYVPKTLPADEANPETVEFASNANFGSPAIRDLHVDNIRFIQNLVNVSELQKALVIPADKSLTVKGTVTTNGVPEGMPAGTPPTHRLIVRSAPNQPNGSLIFTNVADNQNKVNATVEFYSKGYDGNREKQHARWQYFGTPLTNAVLDNVFPANAVVRKYNQAKTNDLDEKWDLVTGSHALLPGHGYEVSQPTPATYLFKGILQVGEAPAVTVAAPASSTPYHYSAFNALSNPYTAAYSVSKVNFGGAEETVYIFNTGSREEWKLNNTATTTSVIPGQYVAIPKNVAGNFGIPAQISSLQGFLIRSLGSSATVRLPYDGLVKNEAALRSADAETDYRNYIFDAGALTIDVVSDKSADRVWLITQRGTSKAFDNGWDGAKLMTQGTAQLFEIGQNENYQVATSDNINNTRLGFVAGDDAQRYTLKFRFDNLEGRYQTLYLNDLQTRQAKEITNGGEYSFLASSKDRPFRFTITEGKPTVAVGKDGEPLITIGTGEAGNIVVRNETDAPATVQVFNIAGHIQKQAVVQSQSVLTLPISIRGLCLVKAANEQAQVTEKIMVR